MRRSRKKHSVTAVMQFLELSKTGSSVLFEIACNGERLGTLEVGRGSLIWKGKNRKKAKRLGWTRFARHMETLY